MATVTKKQTKDGKTFYEIRVRLPGGKGTPTTRWYEPVGWSKRAIEKELSRQVGEFETRIRDAVSAGEAVTRAERKEEERKAAEEAARILTLRQYAEQVFMPSISIRCAENTRSSYQSNLDRWILPVLGEMKMPEISSAQVTALLLKMQADGKAHGTVIKILVILQSLFKMAFMQDMIDRNPMHKVERPRPRKDEKVRDEADLALTADQLSDVLSCLQNEPLKWQAFVTLAADSGARRGELCGLQWSDIDWKESSLKVRRNLQYTKDKGIFETSPKTRKYRVVDIGPETLSLLRQLRDEQASSCVSKWVFTQDGTADPMHPQTPTRYFKKFGKRYGIENFHPHLLRHTSASLALTSGADIKSTADRLGHSEAVLLKKYAHSNPESVRRAGQTVRDAVKKLS